MPTFHPPEWVSQPCRVATLEVRCTTAGSCSSACPCSFRPALPELLLLSVLHYSPTAAVVSSCGLRRAHLLLDHTRSCRFSYQMVQFTPSQWTSRHTTCLAGMAKPGDIAAATISCSTAAAGAAFMSWIYGTDRKAVCCHQHHVFCSCWGPTSAAAPERASEADRRPYKY